MRRTLSLLSIAALWTVPVLAQQPVVAPAAADAPVVMQQAPRPAQTPAPPAPAPAPVIPRAQVPVAPAPPPRPEAIPTQNVRLEVVITDSSSGTTSTKKAITMMIADGRQGRIRSSNSVFRGGFQPITINVDAIPQVRTQGRIQLNLTLEYTPDISMNTDVPSSTPRPPSLNESLSVLVSDGQPMLVSQSADPATDRKVTVEVTATVVK